MLQRSTGTKVECHTVCALSPLLPPFCIGVNSFCTFASIASSGLQFQPLAAGRSNLNGDLQDQADGLLWQGTQEHSNERDRRIWKMSE